MGEKRSPQAPVPQSESQVDFPFPPLLKNEADEKLPAVTFCRVFAL